MDEECEDLSDNQYEDDNISDTEDVEDEDEDNYDSTSKSTNQKCEESPSSGAEQDVTVKLELSILEGEENLNASKDQPVTKKMIKMCNNMI